MKKILIILTLLLLVVALFLFGFGKPPKGSVPAENIPQSDNHGAVRVNGTDGWAQVDVTDEGFGFGVGFARPGKATLMREMGADWTKQQYVSWKEIEPTPPVNDEHRYNWNRIDAQFKEWTGAGFNIIAELWCESTWATTVVKKGVLKISSPPKPEYWDDYALWVREAVERYDGDGYKDMPGLSKPILYYEIESESQHEGQWAGTAEEYIELLRTAYAAAKEANPDVKIVLTGIAFADIFDDFPSDAEIDERARFFSENFGADIGFLKKVMDAKDSYDLIEFHYNRDYKGVYDTLKWIRGYSDKPVWAGDAVMGPWIKPDVTYFVPLFSKEVGAALAKAITDSNDPLHGEVLAWQQKEQAGLVVKKIVCAIDAGLSGINIENIDDWSGAYSAMLGNYRFMGLLDAEGSPKPAYYTYKLLAGKTKGFTSVERLNISGDVLENKGQGVWLFKFIVSGRPVYVAWYEDLSSQCPICEMNEEASASIDLSGYLPEEARITRIIAEGGQMQPEEESAPSDSIVIGESPIFIE